MTAEFRHWGKLHRLVREVVISEKIDGTNACVIVPEHDFQPLAFQSRTRIITPEADNYGFAAWGKQNAKALRELLGPGYHFGEWWGVGINRNYGLRERRFSLFNLERFPTDPDPSIGVYVVPELARGPLCDAIVDKAVGRLLNEGSVAAPGYRNPEGIAVFHTASRHIYKWTFGGDGNKGTPLDEHGNHVQACSVCPPPSTSSASPPPSSSSLSGPSSLPSSSSARGSGVTEWCTQCGAEVEGFHACTAVGGES